MAVARDLDPDDLILDDEDFDLKEAFGLPDRLPPLRLPAEPELAALARSSPLLARARKLAEWVATGLELTDDGDLTVADMTAAARELGLALPAKTELARLWDTALDSGFLDIDFDAGRVHQGEDLGLWPDGSDEEVLNIWSMALPGVLERLEDEALLDEPLDFTGAGWALVIVLFLTRQEGLPVAEASSVIRNAATDEPTPAKAAAAWTSWTDAHGDPAADLLGQLAELGAVSLPDQSSAEADEDGRAARLTPLGTWALRELLIEDDVEIPLLPPPDQMTAADLISAVTDLGETDMEAETAAWLKLQPPSAAAAQLLAVAVGGGAAERVVAVAVAQRLGAAAEAAWRDALDRPELRPYAKFALTLIAGGEAGVDPLPGLEPDLDDVAWLATDMLAPLSGLPDELLLQQISEAIPAGEELEVFEAIFRSPHPDAAEVLYLIGLHHPDRQIGQAARGWAHRARPGQAG